jgi:hypothetical protein
MRTPGGEERLECYRGVGLKIGRARKVLSPGWGASPAAGRSATAGS